MRRIFVGARSERGVAAVEAGIVSTMLMPLLLGVLYFGLYFWQAQRAPIYDPRLPIGAFAGQSLTCLSLLDQVKNDVVTLVNQNSGAAPIDLSDVTAAVTELLPTGGAIVQVSVRVPVSSPFSSFLPNEGAIVNESMLRLEDVTVTDGICR